VRLLEFGHLLRADTSSLQRLAAALRVTPPRDGRVQPGTWRVLLIDAIANEERRLQRLEEAAAIIALGPSEEPDVPARRIVMLRYYFELGMSRAEIKTRAPWALAHELRIAEQRAKR
jgi:hypothetical protein